MKKLLVITLVSVMALAALGAGYALWFDTLSITGTVQTGGVDTQLSPPAAWGDTGDTKNISSVSCYVTAEEDLLSFEVLVAYPSIDYWCREYWFSWMAD